MSSFFWSQASDKSKPIIILLTWGVRNIILSRLVILCLAIIEEYPNGLFHTVNWLHGFRGLVEYFLYKSSLIEKNVGEVITPNGLYNEMAHVAAVK